MKISRRGTSADFGEASIEFQSPAVSWNSGAACFHIKQARVKDFSTKSRHNYVVSLNLGEISDLLQVIAEAAVAEPAKFESALEPSVKSILRLQAIAAGMAHATVMPKQ